MKKKKFFWALLGVFCMSACESSTYLGTDSEDLDPTKTVAIENLEYQAQLEVKPAMLQAVDQSIRAEAVEYKIVSGKQEEIKRSEFQSDLDLSVKFNLPPIVYVPTPDELRSISLVSAGHGAPDVSSTDVEYQIKRLTTCLDYSFQFDQNEIIKASTLFEQLKGNENFPYADIKDIRFKTFSSTRNEELSNADSLVCDVVVTFEVDVEKKEIPSRAGDVETYDVSGEYQRVWIDNDEYDKTILIEKSDKLVDGYREVSVTTAEVYTVTGQRDPVTETYRYMYIFQTPGLGSVYTDNANYVTESKGLQFKNEHQISPENWVVSTRRMEYSSKATNGLNPFDNVYVIDDAHIVYKRNELTVDFPYGEWEVSEKETTISEPVQEGDYNVYSYINKVDYTYTVTEDAASGTTEREMKIYVERPAQKILPEEWGTIIGAAITAVPSDDLGTSVNVAKKCLTIRTDKGAVAVVFDWNNTICTTSAVLGSYFVEGNFDSSYNSGYWTTSSNHGTYTTGVWAPAKARDLTDRIAYYNGATCVRNVTYQTLQMWDWKPGSTTKVPDYTFTVKNGSLNINHDGKVVLRLR